MLLQTSWKIKDQATYGNGWYHGDPAGLEMVLAMLGRAATLSGNEADGQIITCSSPRPSTIASPKAREARRWAIRGKHVAKSPFNPSFGTLHFCKANVPYLNTCRMS